MDASTLVRERRRGGSDDCGGKLLCMRRNRALSVPEDVEGSIQ